MLALTCSMWDLQLWACELLVVPWGVWIPDQGSNPGLSTSALFLAAVSPGSPELRRDPGAADLYFPVSPPTQGFVAPSVSLDPPKRGPALLSRSCPARRLHRASSVGPAPCWDKAHQRVLPPALCRPRPREKAAPFRRGKVWGVGDERAACLDASCPAGREGSVVLPSCPPPAGPVV